MAYLSTGKKFSYAAGGMALNLANLAISQWLLKLYVPNRDEALVNGAVFSVIFLVGRVVDGITEPLVGFYSDHHRSRRGRRIPFIMAGFVPVALVSFLLWLPPFPGERHWLNTVYVFVLVQLFFILWSIVANPYMSLLPEMTPDLDERVNISTMQAGFIMLGTLMFGGLGAVVGSVGWIGVGLAVGIVTIVSFTPTLLAIKGAPSTDMPGAGERFHVTAIFGWARSTFKNGPFVRLLGATASFWFSLNMIIMVIPFFVQYVLGAGDADVVMVMAPFLASNIVFFFVFNYCSKRFGKYAMFLATLGGSAVAMPLLAAVGHLPLGSPMAQTQAVMALVGIPVAGFLMLPMALFADVVDYDETLTGRRREGIYFGVQSIFQKLSIGVSIAVGTNLMYLGGGKNPSAAGLKTIAALAGVMALVAFVIFLKYPLREKDGKIYHR